MTNHNSAVMRPEKSSGPKALYLWLLECSKRPGAVWTLGVLSFLESCVFIIPPEVMLLPMCYAKRERALFFAFITTITSVLGAIAGYYIGMALWSEVSPYAFKYIPGLAKNFGKVGEMYQDNAVSALFLAAFTPIPFKVFTLAAGVYSSKIGLMTLVFTSFVGRGARYGILAGIVYIFGPKAQEIIEKHFKVVTWSLAIIVPLLIVAIKFLKSSAQ